MPPAWQWNKNIQSLILSSYCELTQMLSVVVILQRIENPLLSTPPLMSTRSNKVDVNMKGKWQCTLRDFPTHLSFMSLLLQWLARWTVEQRLGRSQTKQSREKLWGGGWDGKLCCIWRLLRPWNRFVSIYSSLRK